MSERVWSPFPAQRIAILPTAAVLGIALEARVVLALGARNACAAVSIALPIFERKALQIDVRRRLWIALRLRRRGRSVRRGRRRTDRTDGRAARGEQYQQHGKASRQMRAIHTRSRGKAVRRSAENQRGKRVKLYPMNALDSGSASATVAEPSSASVLEIASSPLAQRAQGSRSRARFVHLRLHSEYSIVDGMVRIDDAVAAAVTDSMPALALTDLSNVFGLVKFYTAARKAGVKPIVGCDVWITHDTERDAPHRLLLLCQSRDGYLRLADWLTRAHRTNQHRGRAEAVVRRAGADGEPLRRAARPAGESGGDRATLQPDNRERHESPAPLSHTYRTHDRAASAQRSDCRTG